MNKVVVYTKPNCQQCNFVKNFLTNWNVPFETEDVTENEKALNYIKSLGITQMPVTVAGGNVIKGANVPELEKLLNKEWQK